MQSDTSRRIRTQIQIYNYDGVQNARYHRETVYKNTVIFFFDNEQKMQTTTCTTSSLTVDLYIYILYIILTVLPRCRGVIKL